MKTHEAQLTTVCSYPDRGPWGDAAYRGNCPGGLVRDLIAYYRPTRVLDPMEGGGTTRAVCADLGVDYVGADLMGGRGLDMYGRQFVALVRAHLPIDFIFWHPPYGPMIRYSDHPRDLSTLPVDRFRTVLVQGAERLYGLLAPHGHLVVLIGLHRSRGQLHRFHLDLIHWKAPTEPELIKVQHHCTSAATEYGSARFIPILHEYVLIWRKPLGVVGEVGQRPSGPRSAGGGGRNVTDLPAVADEDGSTAGEGSERDG